MSFPDCIESDRKLPKQEQKYLISSLNLHCEDSIKGKAITLKGLSRVTDALISIRFLDESKFKNDEGFDDDNLGIVFAKEDDMKKDTSYDELWSNTSKPQVFIANMDDEGNDDEWNLDDI